MYKVFINNKSIFIGKRESLPIPSGFCKVIDFSEKKAMMLEILSFEKCEDYETLHIIGNPKKILKNFRSIKAAGGLVLNDKNQILFIFRNGKWDLPKGKVEDGEKIPHAALREVNEECGISGLKISCDLPCTLHTYILNDERVLKTTYWYVMKTSDTKNPIPQTEENITQVEWLSQQEVNKALENSFASIVETINSFNQIK